MDHDRRATFRIFFASLGSIIAGGSASAIAGGSARAIADGRADSREARQSATLSSRAYPFDSLAVKRSNGNDFRAVLDGTTHDGDKLEVRETTLAAGAMPHPPHNHVHEEMFLIRDGTVEVTLSGEATRLGSGSVAFVSSGREHSIKNVGDAPAFYFVVAMGRDNSA